MIYPFAFFENKIVRFEDAKISIATNAFQYGTAVFGGIRAYKSQKVQDRFEVFRMHDHWKRLKNGLDLMGVKIDYSIKDLEKITTELLKKNKPSEDCYIRPVAYADSLLLTPNLIRDKKFNLCIFMIPMEGSFFGTKGMRVKISHWKKISSDMVPSLGKISGTYVNAALARKDAQDQGFDEALMINRKGYIAEGPAENIFIVKGKKIYTPPLTDDILGGITRKTIIQIAKDNRYIVLEKSIAKKDLFTSQEAFFTGTGAQITWIKSIDNHIFGDGKIGTITSEIVSLFNNVLSKNNKKYSRWFTKVNI